MKHDVYPDRAGSVLDWFRTKNHKATRGLTFHEVASLATEKGWKFYVDCKEPNLPPQQVKGASKIVAVCKSVPLALWMRREVLP